jgi:hypothetical protein
MPVRDDSDTSRRRQWDVQRRLHDCAACARAARLEPALWRVVRARLREVRAPEAFVTRLRRVIAAEQATTYDWLVGERS